MPQIDFAQAFAEEDVSVTTHSTLLPPSGSGEAAETPVVLESPRLGLRTARLGRSEWANILFAAIAIAGGLFCAFYFFNGADLVRTALSWPGEYLYPRPLGENIPVVTKAFPDGTLLPGPLPERRSSKTDSSGDPFPRASRVLSLDQPIGSFPRGGGGGLTAGTPSPVLPPPIFGSPLPPGIPGLPGGSVGGLPGPGTLISRLTLLLPGGDALTQFLRRTVANVLPNIVVTVRHDTPRVRTVQRRVVKRILVRPPFVSANARSASNDRMRKVAQNTIRTAEVQQGISSGAGTAGNAQDRMNAGTGAVSVGTSAMGLGGGVGSGVGGAIGGLGSGLRGTVGGAVGGIGGALGLGGHGGGGGRH